MSTQTVLVVEDDFQNRELLYETLTTGGFQVELARNGEEACQKGGEREFSVVLSDIQMGALSGIEVLKWFRDNSPDTPVVLLTAFGSAETAIRAMKEGAFDYLTKPINLHELLMITERAIQHYGLIQENRELRIAFNGRVRAASMVARSRSMLEIFKIVGKVSATRSSVLIYGETGTGKELIARAVHDNSPRASRPFVAINCSALPDSLLESELFGYVKGAFTNAGRLRRGLIEESSGGTLFLDEVADLSPIGQAKLLRVLQDGEMRHLGSNTTIHVDLRVVAASHRNLQDMTNRGLFRDDLLYRLKTVTIQVPPLRERKEDIPLLAELFLVQYAGDKNIQNFSSDALCVLTDYHWPGNVRELQHVIEHAVALGTHPILSTQDLPEELQREAPESVSYFTSPTTSAKARRKAAGVTREDVVAVFESTRGNKVHMAQSLGISRWAVYRLLDKYGLGKDSLKDS